MSLVFRCRTLLYGLEVTALGRNPLRNRRLWASPPLRRCLVTATRTWSTPLAKTIASAIETTGPISISQYMRQCLTSPQGYYASQTGSSDPFGSTGDFVTSPEISQVFGELVGIWVVSQWITQGRKGSGIDLIEVGPGKGTLMDDILRAVRNFDAFFGSLTAIHLVEASAELRQKQKRLLCEDSSTLDQTSNGWSSITKYNRIPVFWYEDIRFVPRDYERTPYIVAHEFFDALPIQAFQSVSPTQSSPQTIDGLHGPIKLTGRPKEVAQTPQWRELMVVPAKAPGTIVTSSRPALDMKLKSVPEFELTLSKASNPSSLVLPEMSDRYKALKNTPGAVIEISSEAHRHAVDFAERIGGGLNESSKVTPAGAALIIDYGTLNTVPTSTLRGIKLHKLVSPFSSPGDVDISADVDFTAVAEAAIDASEGVEVHGPVEQGEWLQRMGIKERAQALRAKASSDVKGQEITKKIQSSMERLIERGGGGMGKLYKVMAIVPESGGRRPVGFGGEVEA